MYAQRLNTQCGGCISTFFRIEAHVCCFITIAFYHCFFLASFSAKPIFFAYVVSFFFGFFPHCFQVVNFLEQATVADINQIMKSFGQALMINYGIGTSSYPIGTVIHP